MNNNQFKGTGVAIVTPFREDGCINFQSLEKIINNIIENKVNFIVALGTTGESSTMSHDEKYAVIDFVIETVNKRVPVVVGAGSNSTQDVVNFIKERNFQNIDAILSVCPYYNKPNPEGIFLHFKTIAGASPVPVIIYNVPGRTSCNIDAATTLRIAGEIPNVIGIKEASGNIEQCMTIINNRPENFLVLSGDDMLTLPLIAAGADGVISVMANAFPKDFSDMVKSALKGDFKKANEIHYGLFDIMKTVFSEGNPSGIKAALEILELSQSNLRLPLVNISENTYKNLKTLINEYQKNK